MDPTACSRLVITSSEHPIWCSKRNCFIQQIVKYPYTYPLNLIVSRKTLHIPLLLQLISCDRKVLAFPDGHNRECTLAILLRFHPHAHHVIQLIVSVMQYNTMSETLLKLPRDQQRMVFEKIKLNGNVCNMIDQYDTTPLHIACMKGSSLQIVTLLYNNMSKLYIQKVNMNGTTAYDLALRCYSCSSELVVDYLQHCQSTKTKQKQKMDFTTKVLFTMSK